MRLHIDTESLRREHPIAELVTSYGIELRRVGAALVGRCPFHQDRGRPNLHVYNRSSRWICYRCGEHGDVIGFVQQMDNLTFREAVARLTHGTVQTRTTIRRQRRRFRRSLSSEIGHVRRPDEYEVLTAAAELYANRLLTDELALGYLARRGFAREVLEQHHIGYASGDELISYLRWRGLPLGAALRAGLLTIDGHEFLTGRITFPEYRAGHAVWMIGRLVEITDGPPAVPGPKYLGLPSDKPLFGWEDAIVHPSGICVVEGPIDLLALRSWGIPGIALVGCGVRHDKLRQLDRFERLYVALDPDPGGRQGTQSLIAYFGARAVPVDLPAGDDVGKLAMYRDGEERFRNAIRTAAAAARRVGATQGIPSLTLAS
jgi:DNA primase